MEPIFDSEEAGIYDAEVLHDLVTGDSQTERWPEDSLIFNRIRERTLSSTLNCAG